ncbi:MAG: RHS repeat-associated core domain-containing protein, partial [Peptostreptococcales bacterium]
REFDSESGLYYYRARYYDAHSGRFLQEDPHPGIKISPNTVYSKYVYTTNSPVNFGDPTGRFLSNIWKETTSFFTKHRDDIIKIGIIVLAAYSGGAAVKLLGIKSAFGGILAGALVGGVVGGVGYEVTGVGSFKSGFIAGAIAGGIAGYRASKLNASARGIASESNSILRSEGDELRDSFEESTMCLKGITCNPGDFKDTDVGPLLDDLYKDFDKGMGNLIEKYAPK